MEFNEKKLEETYKLISEEINKLINEKSKKREITKQTSNKILNYPDPWNVVKTVEEYRYFWKPKEVKVLLWGESYVATNNKDYKIKLKKEILKRIDGEIDWDKYPSNYVKFVYCLGYGENELLEIEIQHNKMGTPQYWKIFASSIKEKQDKILKTKVKECDERLKNKIKILKKMKEEGIWLLDRSIVAIYKGKEKRLPHNITQKIIEITWKNYLKNIVESIKPKGVIFIGKSGCEFLKDELKKLLGDKIKLYNIKQPQARGVKDEEILPRIQEIVDEILKDC